MHICCEIFIIYYLKCLLICSTGNMLQNFEKIFYKNKNKDKQKAQTRNEISMEILYKLSQAETVSRLENWKKAEKINTDNSLSVHRN